jgi:hypothetical protein
MGVVIIAAAICLILPAVGFGVVFTRLISPKRLASPVDDPDVIFSPIRYRVMERLLGETDQDLVASLGDRRTERKFRRARVKIFRGYMLQLSEDFNRICKAIQLLMISSEKDRSELAGVVMKQQFQFAVGMMYVEFKLILYSFGWNGVEAKTLIYSLETMRSRLQGLVAAAEPAGA